MPDPNAVPPDPNAAPATLPDPNAPPAQPLDLTQIKSMLNLPDTATDVELITSLVELISNLQQKYDALLSDATTLQGKLGNRDLEDFADVVPAETNQFWLNQLLSNRDEAITVLVGMRAAKPVAPAMVPAPVRVPLSNRLVSAPKPILELAGGANAADTNRAVAIRNRAHELRKAERLPWSEAFTRAEKEMTK